MLNATHSPQLQSWVESANQPGCDFPIQNLPFGRFRRDEHEQARLGVAIGDQIVDLLACLGAGVLPELEPALVAACGSITLNPLLALGPAAWSSLRAALSQLLSSDSAVYQRNPQIGKRILVAQSEVQMLVPMEIGDYTDFYASVYHATNIGSMFRPDNPLLPNYKYVPIGYHGRASSIVASGQPVRRPHGQLKGPNDDQPTFQPCRLLDYELEVGMVVGPGNQLGQPIPLAEAEQHIFGLCLVNDWSARDIQAWEYQPLGPFLAKNFITTISPWIVTLEALEPFRCAAFERPADDPAPLDYLASAANEQHGGIDLTLEVYLASAQMREQGIEPVRLSRGSFRHMYWTIAQMLTHHASNGCPLQPGDLLASGTVSGPDKDARGCMMELTWRGAEPLELPTGETRRFLEDGDEVILRGSCSAPSAVSIGFGACRGTVLPAL